MSMMAHEVRVLPYKTFRLNLCVCPPYNADFDGDEMNMHVFQTPEARAEANDIMKVQEHILSPRYGGPIIGAIHDHITGAYLLTHASTVYPEDKAFQIIKRSKMELPESKGRDWTGKEIFSLLLPDKLNLIYKAEICRKCEECKHENCEHDAYVVISNGQLLQGVVDDKGYGRIRSKGDTALFGGHTTEDMKHRLGIKSNRPLADFLPTLTIAAKNLATEMTNYNVEQKNLYGESSITREHVQNNVSVRSMLGERGIRPEELPVAEDIKKVERRVVSDDKKIEKSSSKLPIKK